MEHSHTGGIIKYFIRLMIKSGEMTFTNAKAVYAFCVAEMQSKNLADTDPAKTRPYKIDGRSDLFYLSLSLSLSLFRMYVCLCV